MEKNVLNDIVDPAFFSFFKDNSRFVFCYRKASKLLKAIYIITDSVEEKEVVEIRQLAKDMVKDIISLFSVKEGIHKENLHRHLLLLTALFEALSAVGRISAMNANIIMNEYKGILEVIESSLGQPYMFAPAGPNLKENMFEIDKGGTPEVEVLTRPKIFNEQYKGHKGQNIISTYKKDLSFRELKNKNKREAEEFSPKLGKLEKNKVFPNDNKLESPREAVIIKQIRQLGSVTVKDVSGLIRGVSEKTIQRELVALVGRGVLKREGERRWSRYLLV